MKSYTLKLLYSGSDGNAALLCAQILAVEDENLAKKLDEKRKNDAAKVLEKDAALEL